MSRAEPQPAPRLARFTLGRALMMLVMLLIIDQLSKAVVLAHIDEAEPVAITSFFNLVLVWNRGVSFGMFSNAPEWGPYALKMLTIAIAIVLVVWFLREPRTLPRVALALILTGAFGNLIDRLRFGAVVDFLDFHVAGWHWPAFNVADSCIVIGACLLLADGLSASDAKQGGRR